MADATDTDRAWKELLELMRKFVSLKQEEAQRTLRVKIHLLEYTISCEVLNQVFSRFGKIESIEKLDHDAQYHSKICFRERDSALKALDCYDGMCIYDGCCLLELSIEAPFYEPTSHRADQGSLILPPRSSSMVNCKDQELSAPGSVVTEEEEITGVHSCGSGLEYSGDDGDDGNADLEAKPTSFSSVISEVIHSSLAPMVFEIDSDEKNDWIDSSTDLMEFGEADLSMNFSEFLVKVPAHKLFDIMSRRRKFTLVLGDKFLALFASGFTLISSAVEATIKTDIVDHDKPWDPGGDSC